jgi:hypothetical protein
VHLVSQDDTTVTLGWSPQPGYGYLFSADGVLRSRTYDPNRSTVRFAKATSYDIDVIVKGANGHYPDTTPPPPPLPQCSDGVDNDGDGKIDMADPGCSSPTDNDETNVVPQPPLGCTLNATTATFVAQVSAAIAGQKVCLASGNYGTWGGTNKAITVAAASGASPQMDVNFGSGDSGFTLDGMTGMGGNIQGTVNVTIKNSTFTDTLDIEGPNTNLVLDNNTHNWNARYGGGLNGKIFLGNTNHGTVSSPAVTIKNSEIKNGDLDGIHIGGGGGYLIVNNDFVNLCDVGTNHTDNIQFQGGDNTRIAGNYVFGPPNCAGQGITSFDGGTVGVIIENNVVDMHRPWGIELYSDRNSIVRHNTVVWKSDADCDFNGITCGQIDIDRKSADPAGSGTHVYDNVANVSFTNGSTGTADHNVSGQNVVYVGPLTTHDGFLLSPASPVGRGAASDGTNAGVYAR